MPHRLKSASVTARFFQWVKAILDTWWVKIVLGPLIVAFPAGIVNAYLSEETIREALKQWMPDSITNFLDQDPLLAYLLAPAWLYLLAVVYGLVDFFSRRGVQVDIERFTFLHQVLETIVSSKAYRFGRYAKKLIRGELKGKDSHSAFLEITKPNQQLALLAQGLQSFFAHLRPEVNIRVGIAAIEKDIPVEWLYWFPENPPPRTPIEALRVPESTLSTCLKRRTMVIIENTRKAATKGKKQYIVTREDAIDEEGSLLCYPLVYSYGGMHVPYVINIVGDKKECFVNKEKDLYEWMIGHFTLRMGLEHSLLIIKEKVETSTNLQKGMEP